MLSVSTKLCGLQYRSTGVEQSGFNVALESKYEDP